MILTLGSFLAFEQEIVVPKIRMAVEDKMVLNTHQAIATTMYVSKVVYRASQMCENVFISL